MVGAAVILQPGKVELHHMPDHATPPYLRFMKPARPMYLEDKSEYGCLTSSLELSTIQVRFHRMVGLSVPLAYWPDSWQDAWAVEELLKWEGREDEIRRDRYYPDFIVRENQPASPNEHLAIESEPVRNLRERDQPVVLVVRESVHRRSLDPGPNGYSGNRDLHALERGVPGGHETDLPGKDG